MHGEGGRAGGRAGRWVGGPVVRRAPTSAVSRWREREGEGGHDRQSIQSTRDSRFELLERTAQWRQNPPPCWLTLSRWRRRQQRLRRDCRSRRIEDPCPCSSPAPWRGEDFRKSSARSNSSVQDPRSPFHSGSDNGRQRSGKGEQVAERDCQWMKPSVATPVEGAGLEQSALSMSTSGGTARRACPRVDRRCR